MIRPLFALALSLTLLAAPARADDASDKTLAALEQRLIAAGAVRFLVEIKNEGLNPAELKGEYDVRQGNRTFLRATGKFRDEPLDLTLRSDQDKLDGKVNGTSFSAKTPLQLSESLLVKLVRMGVLHTFAVISAKRPPDLAEGDVRRVLEIRNARRGGADKMLGDRITRPISFTLVVSGQAVGEATLWLDLASGLPVRREQKVKLGDQGEMTLVERYEKFELGR
ncbi:hypothetical protein [Roseiterribacter gracilis]|uniref:DUF3108 domain-containing protein n=1 Tax=Roseiterribacter gracilis TaxID=2812848 RepID=A0A8S8XEW4_9PROT|nr:hypothetical protein TMPK1_33910 [Rhodospirillales bacterium TMPK1]